MRDYEDILALFKQRRRNLVDHLEYDDEQETAATLADVQLCIAAIEAVIEEAKAFK